MKLIKTHTHTHIHTQHMLTNAHTCTHTHTHEHVVRNLYGEKYVWETRGGLKLCWKRWVFKACLNDVWESEWRRLYGRSFQVEGPTCENNLFPNALELERGILRTHVSVEEQRSLEGVYRRSSERYCGPVPVITLEQSVEILYALIGSQCNNWRMGWHGLFIFFFFVCYR